MAEFDRMLLEQQKALEEKQRNEPLPERGTGSGGGTGGASTGAGGGAAGAGGPKDDRTPAERRADAEAEAKARAEADAAGKTGPGEKGEGAEAPRTADTSTGGSTSAGRKEGGTPVTSPVEGGPVGPADDTPAAPPDVGDGKDDDVVARQLREAAMKEKDPAIREKLWEEYREYKKGKGGS
jgi:hypothetical protein